ncbi:MAG TPA: hypothetical protein VKF82_12620, partial [Candidatus Eremiobacteraceae bacterium]|nr:hypothetical protein [Candidatus Eremiobacteraceae bacterium]
MSQLSYVWNNNNPISFSDPSGYDSIYLNERPSGIAKYYHAFLEVFSDEGKLKERFSFGPGENGFFTTLDSPLVREPDSYDAKWSGGTNGAFRVKVLQCGGSACQRAEHAMHEAASAIEHSGVRYGGNHNNSNSGSFTTCSAGAGATACNNANRQLGKSTPGWGEQVGYGQSTQTNTSAGQQGSGQTQYLFYDDETGQPL